MRLKDCSPSETTIIAAICALASQLPGDPSRYTQAIGEMRSTYYGINGRGRGGKRAHGSHSRPAKNVMGQPGLRLQ